MLTAREQRYLEMLDYHGPWPGNPTIYVFFTLKGRIVDHTKIGNGMATKEDMRGTRLVSISLSNAMGYNAIKYGGGENLPRWIRISPRITKLLRFKAWPNVEI